MNGSLEVLVPQGRDAHVSYAEGPPSPGESSHEPINFHAMAAATGGGFHASIDTIKGDRRSVLVLIPRRSRRAVEAVKELRKRGHRVLVTWKECGVHQLDQAWLDPDHEAVCGELNGMIDAWVASSPAARDRLAARLPNSRVIELPTPYPVDVPSWQRWAIPAADRSGIFIGTREWATPLRRHSEAVRLAVALAKRHEGLAITVVNTEGWRGWWRIWRAAGDVNMMDLNRMPYLSLLEVMSRHRLVLQRDASGVPGQVAGDALLAGVPCLGGSGMVDGLAFSHLPGAQSGDDVVMAAVEAILTDADHADAVMADARDRAMATVSFGAFRKQWEGLELP